MEKESLDEIEKSALEFFKGIFRGNFTPLQRFYQKVKDIESNSGMKSHVKYAFNRVKPIWNEEGSFVGSKSYLSGEVNFYKI